MNPSLGRNFEAMDPLEWLARGALTDYVVAGHSELLLRKTRGPLVP